MSYSKTYDGWLNLAFIEYTLKKIDNYLLTQIESCSINYKRNLKLNDEEVVDQCLSSLSTIFADLQMIKEKLDTCNIVYKFFISKGDFPYKNKEFLIEEKKKSAIEKLEKVDYKNKEKSLGYELYKYAKGNIKSGEINEKDKFFALAYLNYYLADLFASISGEWTEITHVRYKENYKNVPSPDYLAKQIQESYKILENINDNMELLANKNIYVLHLRIFTNIFYHDWINIGAGTLNRYIQTRENWDTLGMIAYQEIGPALQILKIINNDISKILDEL